MAVALTIIVVARLSARPVETVDLARLLLDLLVVVAAAKLAAEGAERIGVPAVLGEIVAGILVGPSVLGLVEVAGERGVSLGMLAELGVLLLLVQVGMEMDLAELGRVGRASMLVAIIGVAVPFAAGAGRRDRRWASTPRRHCSSAPRLTATSVGITARVFGDLRALATTEARIVLGAAVADDVLGLIILTVVVKVVTGDAVTVGVVASTRAARPRLPRRCQASSACSPCLACCTVTDRGLAIGHDADGRRAGDRPRPRRPRRRGATGLHHRRLHGRPGDRPQRPARAHRRRPDSVGGVLIPVFFVLIGVNADLEAMLRPSVLLDAAVLLAIAIAGKLVVGVRRHRHAQRPPAGRHRDDPARRGRADLRQHRPGPGRPRRRALRRPPAGRAADDRGHTAGCCAGGCACVPEATRRSPTGT